MAHLAAIAIFPKAFEILKATLNVIVNPWPSPYALSFIEPLFFSPSIHYIAKE